MIHWQRPLMHIARSNVSWHSSVLWQRSPTTTGPETRDPFTYRLVHADHEDARRNFANRIYYLLAIQFEELFISKIYESLHAHIPCLHTAFVIDAHTESSVHVNPAPIIYPKSTNKSLNIYRVVSTRDFTKRYSLAMHIDLSGVGE